ncbi:lanthionine synthetase C family protein [Paenibacillus sp. MZ04-78.2]|uniref:lanthionine synthetase C family protein n=1 Tax=Paenibacillus sp. MZ04-78.2 TaxID=2962034 RepID=UPI0020B7EA9D|nr:lanthionine synthetase C family protein [Paenibacillus sp. MZ04-78.2]MCP3776480.1 lanthionine synthetase C family protein [Paenibacillus sp. MZ04-78.2]
MIKERTLATAWRPLNGPVEERVAHVLGCIAKRYKDPEKVQFMMRQVPQREIEGMKIDAWSDLTLANGFTGICLLLGQMDRLFPDEGWDRIGHHYLQQIQSSLEQQNIHSLSLYSGLAGVLVGVRALSRGGTRYLGMLDTLASWFEELVLQKVQICKEQWVVGRLRMDQYDTIQGFAGIGRVVMLFPERPRMKMIWEQIIELFDIFCDEKSYNGYIIPAWHISSEDQFLEQEKVQYPHGNFNLGLSHGITGPLSFMSLSEINGWTTDSIEANIRKLAEWVNKWKMRGSTGTIWPGRVSFEELLHDEIQSDSIRGHRDSWCYGAPGIARSLWLAGHAVQNEEWIASGLNAYLEIEQRIETKGGLTSATLCHGLSGLLHLIQRMYSDTGHPGLSAMRDRFVVDLLDMYNPDSLFGYYDQKGKDGEVDEAGFLTGSAGVALVLASLISKKSPDWDFVLLVH